jgi:parallel beta-helix repeat protein
MSLLRLAGATALASLGLLAIPAGPAAAETLTCTNVASLPTTISVAGHYCLNANFSAAFVASPVTINTSNVVLDCNDHTITQTGTGAPNGITVNNQSNVTVRNCAINGFGRGIAFYETVVNTSRNNRIEHNDVRKSKVAGIQVGGSANLIEANRVSENVGPPSPQTTYGILVNSAGNAGVGNVIRNNIVTNIAPGNYNAIYGIYLLDVDNSVVQGNTISALFPPLDMSTYGIWGGLNSLGTAAIKNTVLSSTGAPPGGGDPDISYGGGQYSGVYFSADPDTYNRNVCRDNVVGHWYINVQVETTTLGCAKHFNTEF